MPILILNVGLLLFDTLRKEIPLVEIGKSIVSILNDVAPLLKKCLNNVVAFVVLLHSIYVFESVSSLVPVINLIALAVSFIHLLINLIIRLIL